MNPIGPEIRDELVAMANRLVAIEDELTRVMQHKLADCLSEGRLQIVAAVSRMRAEADRLEAPL